jgi:hypothetical protein
MRLLLSLEELSMTETLELKAKDGKLVKLFLWVMVFQ